MCILRDKIESEMDDVKKHEDEVVIYVGEAGSKEVKVCSTEGQELRNLQNTDERQIPAIFSWGESGPGAFALAHSLLSDRLGFGPSRQVAMDFAFKVIASFDAACNFEMSSETIDTFIASQGGPEACKDEWEEPWFDNPQSLTLETELIPIDSILADNPEPTASKQVENPPSGKGSVSVSVTLREGSEIIAGNGAVVHVQPGAILSMDGKKYLVQDSGFQELYS